MSRHRRSSGIGDVVELGVLAVTHPKGCLWSLWGLLAFSCCLGTLLVIPEGFGSLVTFLFIDAIVGTPLWLRLWKRHRDMTFHRNVMQMVEQGQRERHRLLMDSGITATDGMNPYVFEEKVAATLEALGYTITQSHGGKGDRGADIICERGTERLVVQCKCYAQEVHHDAVNEVSAARIIFRCSRAAVATNSYFSSHAIQHAQMTGVELWDREELARMFTQARPQLQLPPPQLPPPPPQTPYTPPPAPPSSTFAPPPS